MWKNYIESSDIEPEIYFLVSKNKASLLELDRDYSVSDAYDLLEILEIEGDIEAMSYKDAEQNKR